MPYRPTEATERRKAERRSLILKAAREQIATDGFRGTRVRLVAARAGVSEGTIYRYFPSMTALFTELLRMSAMRELEVATRAATGPGPGADRLAAAVRIHLTRALKRPRLAHALLAEPVAPDVEAERLACRKGFHEMFADVMDQAIAGGEYHPFDTAMAAACITGAIDEAIIWPFAAAPDGAADNPQRIDFVVGFCMAGIAAFRRNAGVISPFRRA